MYVHNNYCTNVATQGLHNYDKFNRELCFEKLRQYLQQVCTYMEFLLAKLHVIMYIRKIKNDFMQHFSYTYVI